MRVVVDATAAVSGGRVYLNQLLPELARRAGADEFVVFHMGDFDGFALPESQARFHFHRVELPWARKGSWIGSSVLKMLWRLVVLPWHLRRLRPELLFSNAGFGAGAGGVKTVLALHNSMPLRDELIADERATARRWRLRLLRRLMHRALRRCDGSIVFSEDTRRRLAECFPDLGHTPAVVHHGIDWGERERTAADGSDDWRRLGLGEPYLLYVSQFHRYKNVLLLLAAFAQLAARHTQLKLVLVGDAADADYWREIEATVARLGLRERVRHIPACPRPQLLGVYRHALAFVHPSLAETCSFPLLEALALGVPVAAARSSALPEMAGDAAIYFDPYNADDLAAQLERLVWDEKLRDELSAKAVARAAQFSWAETGRKTLAVFQQLVVKENGQD